MSKPTKSIIEYRKYDLPLDFPVLLLDGDRWHISEIKSEYLHFHNCLEIGMCLAGSGTMILNNDAVNFKGGDVTCIPRHFPHTTYSSDGNKSLWSYLFVDLGKLFWNFFHNSAVNFDIEESTFENSPYIMNKQKYPKIYFLIMSIIEEMRHEQKSYRTGIMGLFLSLYVELNRLLAVSTVSISLEDSNENSLNISPALNYIQKNYMHSFTVEYLAELCHLSTTHFRKTFLSIMGTTPLIYVNGKRIDEACILLQSTDRSILSIAELVGFRSISSFNRYFNKLMRVSPRDYRNPKNRPERKIILEYNGWL